MSTSRLTDIGDKELWGLYGKNYCIPFYLQPYKNAEDGQQYRLAWPAVVLDMAQTEAFYNRLAFYSLCKHDKYVIFGFDDPFPEFVSKIDGMTPERYFVWNGDEAKAEFVEAFIEDDRTLEDPDDVFIREVHARTQLVDPTTLKLIWHAINWTAMNWLIVRDRPVKFAFGTIASIPFRVNWKSILLKGYPRSYSLFCGKKTMAKSVELMRACGLYDSLLGKELLEVVTERESRKLRHYCARKIEVIESDAFRNQSNKSERYKLDTSGEVRYANHIGRTIKRYKEFLIAAYRQFSLRSAQPSADLAPVGSGHNAGVKIVAHTPKGGIDPRAAANGSGVICSDSYDAFDEAKLTTIGTREDRPVRAVQDVQQEVPQLRDAGPDVVQPDPAGG